MAGTAAAQFIVATTAFAMGIVFAYFLFGRRRQVESPRASAAAKLFHEERRARERVEEALRLREEWYRVLFNSATDMVFLHGITSDGLPDRFLEANDIACAKLEHSREQLLALTPIAIEFTQSAAMMPGYSRSELATTSDEDVQERFEMESTHDARLLMKLILEKTEIVYDSIYVSRTGKRIPVEVKAHKFDRDGCPLILSMAHDVSERRAVEQALRDSEQRFRDFFANSPLGVAMYAPDRTLINVNRACLRMLGIPGLLEFGRFNMFDNPFIPPAIKGRLDNGETVRYEADIDFDEARKRGSFVSVRQGCANIEILMNSMGVDADYNPRGYLVYIQDVTERRKAEDALRQRETQLEQARKMEAIGTLAGGIAHDFNNILTPILGYAEITKRSAQSIPHVQEFMDEIIKGSHRAKDLIGQILTFSRRSDQDEGKRMRVKVAPIVKEVLKLLRASAPASIEIERVIKTESDTIFADPTQIHQVIMNLCTNAVHAMRETGGTLEVRMSDFVLTNPSRSEFPGLERGRYMRLSVKDAGTGMDRATRDRIFEPFFTTKKKGEGTGMGLAVVHGIVTNLMGGIIVDTELGRGTTFHVALPTIEAGTEAGPEAGAEAETALREGSECVLMVDDEEDIVRMGKHMLAALGYTPVVTNRGPEALKLFEENPSKFDVVITDQVMPDMSGAELAKKILNIRPDIPIICCSGFSEAFSPEQAKRMGISKFLKKPIEMAVLAEAIRGVLEGKPTGQDD